MSDEDRVICHVIYSHVNEAGYIYKWVVSYRNQAWGFTHSQVAHVNELCYTWVLLHICHTCGRVMLHMSHVWMSHTGDITHMDGSCHTYVWHMSLIKMSRVTHMNDLCHAYECGMSNIRMVNVSHMNASWLIQHMEGAGIMSNIRMGNVWRMIAWMRHDLSNIWKAQVSCHVLHEPWLMRHVTCFMNLDSWGMSHVSISHLSYVMGRVSESWFIHHFEGTSIITHASWTLTHEACFPYEWVRSHVWMGMSYVTHANGLFHTHECVMWDIWMGDGTCDASREFTRNRNRLQHTATHCNILQHTATHCDTLQHTAIHCTTLQHTAMHSNSLQLTAAP